MQDTTPTATIERPAALLGWYTGDNGRALYSPDGAHVCNHDNARALCLKLNTVRLFRLREQREAREAGEVAS